MRIAILGLLLGLVLGAGGCGENAGTEDNEACECTSPEESGDPGEEDERRASQLVDSAMSASVEHDNTRAEELLTRALEIYPDYGLAHAWLGRVLHELGRYEEALEHHLRAAQLADERALRDEQRREASIVCYSMADKAMQAGEYTDAERHVRRAMDLGRESYGGLVRLGDALRGQAKLKEAEEAYRRASGTGSDTQRHEALFKAGKIQHDRENYTGAVETFTELIAEGYTGQDVYAWRGYCRYLLEDYENALDDYAAAQHHATSDEKAREYAELEGRLARMLYADD